MRSKLFKKDDPTAYALLSGSRVGAVVDLHHVLDGELSVLLCGGEALVAEKFLNGTQVCSFRQQMSAESVAQGMRMDVWRQSFSDSDLLYDPGDATRGQSTAATIDEKPARIFSRLGQYFLTGIEIDLQSFFGFTFEWNVALFLAFAPDQHQSVGGIEIA